MVVRVDSTLRLENDSHPHSEGWWEWSVWVEGSPEHLAAVQSVTYRLHPTFPNPVVDVTDASTKFRLTSVGWGEFAIAADVLMKDGQTVRLEHWLQLEGAERMAGSSQPRPSVFLSYSIADQEIVNALSEKLEKQGIEVRTAGQSVSSGDDSEFRIETTLQQSDAVVALFSNPPSRWVEQEAISALKKGAYVMPVVLGGAETHGKLAGLARFELSDAKYIDGLAHQIAARVKDAAIPEEV